MIIVIMKKMVIDHELFVYENNKSLIALRDDDGVMIRSSPAYPWR